MMLVTLFKGTLQSYQVRTKVHLVQLQHLTSASTDAPFLQGCCISTSILTTALILTLLINILPISNSLLPPRPCPLPLPF